VKNADPLMTSKGNGAIAQSDVQAGTALLEVEKLFEISVHGKIGRLSNLVRQGRWKFPAASAPSEYSDRESLGYPVAAAGDRH
jgi:hypothetical protein